MLVEHPVAQASSPPAEPARGPGRGVAIAGTLAAAVLTLVVLLLLDGGVAGAGTGPAEPADPAASGTPPQSIGEGLGEVVQTVATPVVEAVAPANDAAPGQAATPGEPVAAPEPAPSPPA